MCRRNWPGHVASIVFFSTVTIALYWTLVNISTANTRLPFRHLYYLREHHTDAITVLKPSFPSNVVPCIGARGHVISENLDDQLESVELATLYPQPLAGSHSVVGLDQVWHSASGRYGAYGFGEEVAEYSRSRVAWKKVDWARLQNDCLAVNKFRFSRIFNVTNTKRFTYRNSTAQPNILVPPRSSLVGTGRTAIVLRSWSSFRYTPEDMWNIRSLIAEAALESGGSKTVFLLVDIHGESSNFLTSQDSYESIIREVVPPELQDMTVLFDKSLLESWYPMVEDHSPEFQMYQALQLFAHFYSEFDYYWQLEMDTRFTSHVGKYLRALENFAKREPRKQAVERNSYTYMPLVHGTYENFTATINQTLNGSGHWGPYKIPDIRPIGPVPPTATPEEENFSWGVGEEADVILMSKNCLNTSLETPWVYKDWAGGFKDSLKTPRLSCPPAMSRTSWNLLNAAHESQITKGLRVPSEATPSSFALWHGLKIVRPPQPWYYEKHGLDVSIVDAVWNGGPPTSHLNNSGMAHGALLYYPQDFPDIEDYRMPTTYDVFTSFVPRLMDIWFRDDTSEKDLPWMMAIQDGHIMIPNMIIHPRKTNRNP